MKNKICILSGELASQIAAGEVVERPASVVKELMENALDAGAARVEVSIESGGLGLIEICDDGRGMSEHEAPLSLERHATSKLKSFSDLDDLASYGFRGEALPSIASVSRLKLRTRDSSSESGVELSVEGTQPLSSAPVGCPVGTTLSVRDLFFNVPARRKFLRSSNTESGHVGEIVIDMALARPDVAFSLQRDGRRQKNFSRVGSRRERVEQVLGEEVLHLCEGERGPLRVEAYLCGPDRARRGAGGLKLIVNGRPVRDRALTSTIAHAYGGSLERGRFPRGVIYLTLPGQLLDVNVHPQKTEVRFASTRAVLDALHSVVSRGMVSALEKKLHGRVSNPPLEQKPEPAPSEKKLTGLKRPPAPIKGASRSPAISLRPLREPVLHQKAESAAKREGSRYGLPMAAPVASQGRNEGPGTWRNLRLLGQLAHSYLICEGREGLYVIDRHAAEERVLATQLKAALDKGRLPSQVMLFPLTLELSKAESELVASLVEPLKRLGVDVRVRTELSVSVHAVPKDLPRVAPQELLSLLLKILKKNSKEKETSPSSPSLLQECLRVMACLGASSPGDVLERQGAEALLRGLRSADFEVSCRHGRPLLVTLSLHELARKVGQA